MARDAGTGAHHPGNSTVGLKLLGIDPIEHAVRESDGGLLVDETRDTAITGPRGGSAEAIKTDVAALGLPKAGSKLDTLIAVLRRPDGATMLCSTFPTGKMCDARERH